MRNSRERLWWPGTILQLAETDWCQQGTQCIHCLFLVWTCNNMGHEPATRQGLGMFFARRRDRIAIVKSLSFRPSDGWADVQGKT
jgi:hypothetical protein